MVKALFYFTVFIYLSIIPVMILYKKYKNPYSLVMIFGKKGSGKSTLLTKLAIKHMRKGRKVYSTYYIPGTYLFDVQDIGRMQFDPDSVIIVDEVGMIWDNRNFKNFRTDVRDWFKLQRQYRNIVYLASQTFDIDLKLRNLTDKMYLCKCYMGFFSIARKIKRDVTLVQPTGDAESRIADSLEFEPIWMSLFGAQTVIPTYTPHWGKAFKSYNPPTLPPMVAQFQPIPNNLKKFYKLKGDKNDKRRMAKHRTGKRNHRIGKYRIAQLFRHLRKLVCAQMQNRQGRNRGQD